MSQLDIAAQFRNLASNKDTHSLLLNDDNMMKTVITFLDASDDKVVLLAIEALFLLSESQEHINTLVQKQGLLSKIARMVDARDDHKGILSFSQKTLDNLQSVVNGKEPKKQTTVGGAFGVRGYLHNMTIHIKDMNDEETRNAVEKVIIGVKGVVSITIEKNLKQAILYCALTENDMFPKIQNALDAAGHVCEKVDIKGYGCGSTGSNKENQGGNERPSYISKEGAGRKGSLVNVNTNSLKARFEKKKNGGQGGKQDGENSSGFFSSVSSYFW